MEKEYSVFCFCHLCVDETCNSIVLYGFTNDNVLCKQDLKTFAGKRKAVVIHVHHKKVEGRLNEPLILTSLAVKMVFYSLCNFSSLLVEFLKSNKSKRVFMENLGPCS